MLDEANGKIVGLVRPLTGTIESISRQDLYGFSPRVRELERDPDVAVLLAKAANRLRVGRPSMILLLPLPVDFAIMGGLAQQLARQGIDLKSLSGLEGEYVANGGRLSVAIEEAVVKADHRRQALTIRVDL